MERLTRRNLIENGLYLLSGSLALVGAGAEIRGVATDRQGTFVSAVGKSKEEIKQINDERRNIVDSSFRIALTTGHLGFIIFVIASFVEGARSFTANRPRG